MNGIRATILLLLLTPLLPALAEKEEPTPAERVTKMKHDLAELHFRLGNWAKGKKLLKCAFAHYHLAIRLESDHRSARGRLGHRKGKSGEWEVKKKLEWEDARGAWEKHGEEFEKRERKQFDEVVAELEKLGVALQKEGEKALARPLLLRAFLLDDERENAARALGLKKLGHSFAVPETQKAVTGNPGVSGEGESGLLGSVLGFRTTVRSCGSVTAEITGSADSAVQLARLGHKAQVLTSSRFGVEPARPGWVILVVARDEEQWGRFVDGMGVEDPENEIAKRIGSLSGAAPRLFMACRGGSDTLFSHAVAEFVLFTGSDGECPAWLHEAVGVDASITLLGKPGVPCIAYESSTGLHMKDALSDHRQWARLMLRRAAAGDMSKLPQLVYAQIQALGPEDVMASWIYYRYLLLEYREGLGKYLNAVAEGDDPEENFEDGFDESAQYVMDEFLPLFLGE